MVGLFLLCNKPKKITCILKKYAMNTLVGPPFSSYYSMMMFVHTAGMLDNTQPVLSGGACVALGEIGRNSSLPLDSEGPEKKVTKFSIVENLIKKIHTTKENAKV